MSAQGSAPRATLDLKVRVWGMGANNQPFFQNADRAKYQLDRGLHLRH